MEQRNVLWDTYSIQVFFQIIWDCPQNINYDKNGGGT